MPYYVYRCASGHETEKRGGLEETSAPCSICGKSAQRRGFNHVAIVGETVPREQRQDVRNFQEASAEVDYHYTKAETEGMPVKRPNLWKQAKKKAKAQGAQLRSN